MPWTYKPQNQPSGTSGYPRRRPRWSADYSGKHKGLVHAAEKIGTGPIRYFVLDIIAIGAANYLVFYFSSKIGSVANIMIMVTTFVALAVWLAWDALSIAMGEESE